MNETSYLGPDPRAGLLWTLDLIKRIETCVNVVDVVRSVVRSQVCASASLQLFVRYRGATAHRNIFSNHGDEGPLRTLGDLIPLGQHPELDASFDSAAVATSILEASDRSIAVYAIPALMSTSAGAPAATLVIGLDSEDCWRADFVPFLSALGRAAADRMGELQTPREARSESYPGFTQFRALQVAIDQARSRIETSGENFGTVPDDVRGIIEALRSEWDEHTQKDRVLSIFESLAKTEWGFSALREFADCFASNERLLGLHLLYAVGFPHSDIHAQSLKENMFPLMKADSETQGCPARPSYFMNAVVESDEPYEFGYDLALLSETDMDADRTSPFESLYWDLALGSADRRTLDTIVCTILGGSGSGALFLYVKPEEGGYFPVALVRDSQPGSAFVNRTDDINTHRFDPTELSAVSAIIDWRPGSPDALRIEADEREDNPTEAATLELNSWKNSVYLRLDVAGAASEDVPAYASLHSDTGFMFTDADLAEIKRLLGLYASYCVSEGKSRTA